MADAKFTPIPYVPAPFDNYYLKMRSEQKHKVLVAVMDTGVDPGAFGLLKCPDGSPKIVDVIDCTGSDDLTVTCVDIQEIPAYRRTIGRILDARESDEFIRSTYKLYRGIRSFRSFVAKRKYKDFDEKQKKKIDEYVLNVIVITKLDPTQSTDSSQCIIDYDGEEDNFIVLNEYHIDHRFGSIPLGNDLMMNFGYHLYTESDEKDEESEATKQSDKNPKDTKICSLVFDTGSHATHVAGIIGGNFPDPMFNGINPNCQILSLKIGDLRVDGMETSIALIRAFQELVKRGCHIVNYSYGEPVGKHKGRFIELMNQFMFNHNITFITSAGNSGPGMTTVGAPATVSDRAISVGAFTDSQYLDKLYHLTENGFESGNYHWSSRGPGINDSMGVDVMAPGCALTSHPRWYKSSIKMCNGTSMAAPNTAGFLSLVLSQFESPGSYPHTFWLKRYLESTCCTIKGFETFSQGHGLIGQKAVSVDMFFANMCNYHYDISVNNDDMKKGIVNYLSPIDNNKRDMMTYFNIDVKLEPLPEKHGHGFKSMEAFHQIRLVADEHIKNHVTSVDTVMIHPGCMSIRVGVLRTEHVSGYIKMYELENSRYVYSVAINQFVCNEIEHNGTLTIEPATLNPGHVARYYVVPRSTTLNISLNSKINQKIMVDVTQNYHGVGYDLRSCDKQFTPKSNKPMTFNFNVVPNSPTEIVVYTPWNASQTEEFSMVIKGMTKNVMTDKHLYELSETIPIKIGTYLDQTDGESFKACFNVDRIISKYHPTKAEIMQTDPRYVDKDGKALKLLRLTYPVNEHGKCTYYINTTNRVYDSTACMSGCINGFKNGRRVFFANYVSKFVDNPVNLILIDFMDSDINVLRECMGTVLTASRSLPKPITTSVMLQKGMNFVEIPSKDILKLSHIHNGDFLQCSILDEVVMIMYMRRISYEKNKQCDKEHKSIKKYMTNFDHVKRFLNNVTNTQIYDVVFNHDESLDLLEGFVRLIDPDHYSAENYQKLLDMSVDDRNKYQYIGTLMCRKKLSLDATANPESDTTVNLGSDDESVRFSKRLETIYNRLQQQKLLDTAPYSVINLAYSIMDKKNDVDDIDNKLKIISCIEAEMNCWKNCSSQDLDKLRKYLICTLDISDDREKKNRIIGMKRKCDLIENSDEMIF